MAIWMAALPVVNKLLDLIPNKNAAERLRFELEQTLAAGEQDIRLATIKNNQIDARSNNMFQAGWRPMLGWVCAIGFAWITVGDPLMHWVAAFFRMDFVPPKIEASYLMELTLAMLGLAGMRGMEKHATSKLESEVVIEKAKVRADIIKSKDESPIDPSNLFG